MLALALVVACTTEEAATYTQYNAADNSVEIDVGSETRIVLADDGVTEIPEVASVTLTSSTGAVAVGLGEVSPSAGPLGTLHTVSVAIDDAYSADVDRVAVLTESGERGSDEYDLERDSAGEGYWLFELESVGDEGEMRTDTFTFRLYVEDEPEE